MPRTIVESFLAMGSDGKLRAVHCWRSDRRADDPPHDTSSRRVEEGRLTHTTYSGEEVVALDESNTLFEIRGTGITLTRR